MITAEMPALSALRFETRPNHSSNPGHDRQPPRINADSLAVKARHGREGCLNKVQLTNTKNCQLRQGLELTNGGWSHCNSKLSGCQWRQARRMHGELGLHHGLKKSQRLRLTQCSDGNEAINYTGPAHKGSAQDRKTYRDRPEDGVAVGPYRMQGDEWRNLEEAEFLEEQFDCDSAVQDRVEPGGTGPKESGRETGRGRGQGTRFDDAQLSPLARVVALLALAQRVMNYWLSLIRASLESIRVAWWANDVDYDLVQEVTMVSERRRKSGAVCSHANKSGHAGGSAGRVIQDGVEQSEEGNFNGRPTKTYSAESQVYIRSYMDLQRGEGQGGEVYQDSLGEMNEDDERFEGVGRGESRDGDRFGDEEDVDDPWRQIRRFWNNPAFVRFRVSISMANLTMAIPTFLARALPLLQDVGRHQNVSQWMLPLREVSLPILAPLLFGGGIAFKSVTNNLGYVLPRFGMAVVMLWVLWGVNSVLQEAVSYLRDHGAVDRRVSNVLLLAVELTVSAIAVVTSLSSIGVKTSSLVMPFFIVTALAGKDVFHNYFAGFFLFAAQPFRPGDTVAVLCNSSGGPPSVAPSSHLFLGAGWFEGICDSVDLRYTVLRNGRHRLMVPNSRFVQKEFMVVDVEPLVHTPGAKRSPRHSRQSAASRANHNGSTLTEVSRARRSDEGVIGGGGSSIILPNSPRESQVYGGEGFSHV